MNPIYAIFMQGGCSDVMYKSMLESFDEAGKFYVSGTTSEWKIVYE
ncbi:MAG: hypothetical protein LBU14_04080 [Candidatus Peribacteria bacterium]|jgi:hypothetical protein|nr:hypothetical protein [Candidatus Peribacteria bacterium]